MCWRSSLHSRIACPCRRSQIVYGVDFDATGTIYSTGFATGNIYPAGYQTYTASPGIAEVFLYGVKP